MPPPTVAPALPGFLEVIRQVSSQFVSHQEGEGGRGIILSKNEFVETRKCYSSRALLSPVLLLCMRPDGPLLFCYGSATVTEDGIYLYIVVGTCTKTNAIAYLYNLIFTSSRKILSVLV